MMSTWLTAAGALPFILLGALHFRMTVVDLKEPQQFIPAKRELLEELKATRMNFRKDLKNFWLTYLGLHFSHSIGVMFYGLVVMYCALVRPDILGDMTVRLAIVAVGASYVLMARMFWFIIPLVGSLVGVSLIAVGMAMRH